MPSEILGTLSTVAVSPDVSVLLVNVVREMALGSRATGSDGSFLCMSTATGGTIGGGLLGSTLMSTLVMIGGSVGEGLLGSALISTLVTIGSSVVVGLLGSALMSTLVTIGHSMVGGALGNASSVLPLTPAILVLTSPCTRHMCNMYASVLACARRETTSC